MATTRIMIHQIGKYHCYNIYIFTYPQPVLCTEIPSPACMLAKSETPTRHHELQKATTTCSTYTTLLLFAILLLFQHSSPYIRLVLTQRNFVSDSLLPVVEYRLPTPWVIDDRSAGLASTSKIVSPHLYSIRMYYSSLLSTIHRLRYASALSLISLFVSS